MIQVYYFYYSPIQWRLSLKHHGRDGCSASQTHCNTKYMYSNLK